MNILEKIVETKKKELLDYTPDYISFLEKKILERKDKAKDFKGSITKNEINIIAEVKKASPSKGIIREDFDPVSIAKIYEENGASAISVLTDKKYFQGDILFIEKIRKSGISLPLLRKDFIIDKRQILEAFAFGADTFLLIARILSEKEMRELIEYGREFGMEPLIEIHSKEEGIKSLYAGAKIVGINNRNLETFSVDINLSKKLAPEMKELGAEVIVAESGISTKQEIQELLRHKVDAFLIGEALMRERDISKKLKELVG